VRGDPPKTEGGTAVKETTVSVAQAALAQEAVLPARVQEALGELVGAAKEGLLALSVGVGLGVMAELMEEEVTDIVGPKGKHDPGRAAVRHGHETGAVTLGGRRVQVKRPRVRTVDGEGEVPLETYRHFADRDPLTRLVLEQGRTHMCLFGFRIPPGGRPGGFRVFGEALSWGRSPRVGFHVAVATSSRTSSHAGASRTTFVRRIARRMWPTGVCSVAIASYLGSTWQILRPAWLIARRASTARAQLILSVSMNSCATGIGSASCSSPS
jgi:hypothetical protein